MKSLVILATFLFVASVSGAQSVWSRGRKVGRAVAPVPVKAEDVCKIAEGKRKVCKGLEKPNCDATEIVYCTSAGKVQFEIECGGDFPHCVNDENGEAKCSSTKSKACGAVPGQSDFKCFSAGAFPDITDCHKYYFCHSDGQGGFEEPEEIICDDYSVFDPNGFENDYCRFTNNRNCITLTCKGLNKNVLMNYPTFPQSKGQIVASCRDEKKPYVFKCPAGFTANLRTFPVECDLDCRGSGKFEDADDSTRYIECVWNGRGWEPKSKGCYRNYYFDKIKKQCVVNPTPAARTTTTVKPIVPPVNPPVVPPVAPINPPVVPPVAPIDPPVVPPVAPINPPVVPPVAPVGNGFRTM